MENKNWYKFSNADFGPFYEYLEENDFQEGLEHIEMVYGPVQHEKVDLPPVEYVKAMLNSHIKIKKELEEDLARVNELITYLRTIT